MTFFVMFSLVLLFWVVPTKIKVSALAASEAFTPRTYPSLVAGALLLVSTIGLVKALTEFLRLRKENPAKEKVRKTAKEWQKDLFPYLVFVLILAYMLIFRFWGIIPATLLVPPVLLWLLRCRKWQMYLFLYLFAGIIYLLFTKLLLVPLR